MSGNSQGRYLLAEKDFVDVVNEDGEVVGSVPKHWDDDVDLAPGLKKKAKGSRAASRQSSGGDGSDGPKEPAGNASVEDWTAYAKAKGATDADLVDDKGEPLGRDELRAKYGTPKS